jgi:hypothetical protein
MSESSRVGPSGLTAGLLDDLEHARKDQLSVDQLKPLLVEYRATGDGATAIQNGLRYLAYDALSKFNPNARVAWEDLLGPLFLDLSTFVERLWKNDFTAAEIPSKLAKELKFSVTHYMRECSGNILPKKSTNSMRKKRNAEPYSALQRDALGPITKKTDSGDAMTQQRTLDNIDAKNGREQPLNHNERTHRIKDDLWAAAENESEEDFVDFLRKGHSLKEVYDLMGLSRRQGEKILNRLRRRLREEEY